MASFPLEIIGWGLEFIPGDLADARFNNYILEHNYQYVIGKARLYWDGAFMFPNKNVIALSDNLMGTAPAYVGFRFLGFDRESAYQLWIIALFALNYLSCFYCLKRWMGNTIAAISGAYIFGFSIFILGNIYNIQTLPRFISPWVFYWVWMWLKEFKLKHFIYTILGIVYQFYCGIYLGFFLSFIILVFGIILLGARYREVISTLKQINLKIVGKYLLAFCLCLLPLVLLMLPYLNATKEHEYTDFIGLSRTIPRWSSYFFTADASVSWPFLTQHAKYLELWWCHHMYPGAIPYLGLLISIAVLVGKKFADKKAIWVSLLALIVCVAFTTMFGDFTLYEYIYEVPGFSSIRSVNRIMNTEIILLIILLALGIKALSKTKAASFLFLFPILLVIDNQIDAEKIGKFEKSISQERISQAKEWISNTENPNAKPIAMLGLENLNSTFQHLDAMFACQELGLKCVNAYTGYFPFEYDDFLRNMDRDGLNKWLNYVQLSEQDVVSVKPTIKGELIALKSQKTGLFLCIEQHPDGKIIANRSKVGDWETFYLDSSDLGYSIKTTQLAYLSINESNLVGLTSSAKASCAYFELQRVDSGHVTLKSCTGKYLAVDEESMLLGLSEDDPGLNEGFEIIILR